MINPLTFIISTISGFVWAKRVDAVTGEVLVFWTGATSVEGARNSDSVRLAVAYNPADYTAWVNGKTYGNLHFDDACALAEIPVGRVAEVVV